MHGASWDYDIPVFTLQSIKSRIETIYRGIILIGQNEFLLYSPLNQGLKLISKKPVSNCRTVFTLQSIKSRIETLSSLNPHH